MYMLFSLISLLIRNFALPNPFEALRGQIVFNYGEIPIEIPPEFLNIVAEYPLYIITFAIVGIFYSKGIDDPIIGSVLYFVFYCVHIGLLYLLSLCGFATWAIVVIVGMYIALLIGIKTLKNRVAGGV